MLICLNCKLLRLLYKYLAFVHSCYGAVQSLSGDAERDVAVEAVGQGECTLYSEDTVTDEEGRFRLRGLLVRLFSFQIYKYNIQYTISVIQLHAL